MQRVRHIQCIIARNLTFTQNSNQRTLASALAQPNSQLANTSNTQAYPYHARSITPSVELPSGASSPTRSYFRSPWKSYQGIQKVKGPGSETGSTSASDSGRTSMIREPIARLSAGLKASVFSATSESGYVSESGTASGLERHFTEERSGLGSGSKSGSWNQKESSLNGRLGNPASVPSTPPPTRDRYLSPNTINSNKDPAEVTRLAKEIDQQISIQDDDSRSASDMDESQLPQFINKERAASKPILLDSYFTLHEPTNDTVIYTSETVVGTNNPKYSPIEQHQFVEDAAKRSNSVTVKIWAGLHGSETSLLLEWRVQLCCLRFIGKELRDIPAGLPNNTILFGLENGFYTAPDDEDMTDHHDHSNAQDSMPPHSMTSRSYTYESVMRLNNLHECIADTKKSRDEIKHNIEVALNKDSAPMIMGRVHGETVASSETTQDTAAALKKEHAARRQALIDSRERGATQDMYLEENMTNLANNKESLFNTLKEYSTKRTELIATLFTIFPITETENDPNLLKICNVPLPNSVYIGYDEDMVAISLGFVSHFVTMLAHYLNLPLRYPLTPMGSRAFVLDPVSLLVGPKEFPLFGKGQDRHRFEYGVFLLNKDIEQLMNSQGLNFMDLRQTLPNLRYLMETLLTTSPAQSMLYRSKFMNRKKQDRLEQERLNDLFIISLEQREFEHILHPGKDNEDSSTDTGRRRHEKQLSAGSSMTAPAESRRLTNISSERMPLLVREYDPIDGEYTLVLTDPASPRSNASRKSATAGNSKLNDDGPDVYRTPRASHAVVSTRSDEGLDVPTWSEAAENDDEDDADMTAVGDKFDSTRESSTGSSGTQASVGITSTLTRVLLDSASSDASSVRKIDTRRFSIATDIHQIGSQAPSSPPFSKSTPTIQPPSSPLLMLEKNNRRNRSRSSGSNIGSQPPVLEGHFDPTDTFAGSNMADIPPLPPRSQPHPPPVVANSRASRLGAKLVKSATTVSSATKEAILRRQGTSPTSNVLEASG
ncbi:hypothetical protein BG006_008465 [Podila minutissima]|uniref:UV radiation resistance associated protein n=1 Tax=Podila minutissima TaxID=64525 RepID=A0A9P5SFU7_9FUNG|nr:hypothetical protein BG006_008465 [Podila minutissima]